MTQTRTGRDGLIGGDASHCYGVRWGSFVETGCKHCFASNIRGAGILCDLAEHNIVHEFWENKIWNANMMI